MVPYFLSKCTVLFQCKKTEHEDWQTRPVYALQGISVSQKYQRQLWFILPWVMKSSPHLLDVWKDIDYSDADMIRKIPRTSTADFDLAILNDWGVDTTTPAMVTDFADQVVLPFTITGFETLIGILSRPEVPFLNFAFGINPLLTRSFPRLGTLPIVSHVSPPTTTLQKHSDRELSAYSQFQAKPALRISELDKQGPPSEVPLHTDTSAHQHMQRSHSQNQEKPPMPKKKIRVWSFLRTTNKK